ncbi:MAG: histidine phosphatase family protein [Lachnospiraceae bacterium]|nr:histidine phosphatase family protein [Lachnospiraceae bacterium]
MLLYYIRHGDPTYDPDALTPLGKRQAEAVARRLTQYGLDEIYVSSSRRAQETCAPTCEILKKEPVVLDWTNEHYAWQQLTVLDKDGHMSWGFIEPRSRKVFASPEIANLRFDWYTHPFFEGTQFEAGIKRIQREAWAFLESQGLRFDPERGGYKELFPNEKRIAIFAHHGFGLAFLSVLLNIPYPEFCVHFNLSHSNFCVIEFGKTDDLVIPEMLMHSNDSHLYREGIPTKYNNVTYI